MTKREAVEWFNFKITAGADNMLPTMLEAYRLAERALRRSIRATRAVKKNAIARRREARAQ